jgi:hypothetical protein
MRTLQSSSHPSNQFCRCNGKKEKDFQSKKKKKKKKNFQSKKNYFNLFSVQKDLTPFSRKTQNHSVH